MLYEDDPFPYTCLLKDMIATADKHTEHKNSWATRQLLLVFDNQALRTQGSQTVRQHQSSKIYESDALGNRCIYTVLQSLSQLSCHTTP